MELNPELVLKAYSCGVFPMGDSWEASDIQWIDPDQRGILPLDGFHIPKRLARTIRRDEFVVTIDLAFAEVIKFCAEPMDGRETTWINGPIIQLYTALHHQGHAHSVEVWKDNKLVGGLYGISLGAAFFGESMFRRVSDASKIALVHLACRLKYGGYTLLDTQFLTQHLERFGAIEISRKSYHQRLGQALAQKADFQSLPEKVSGERVLQLIAQTS